MDNACQCILRSANDHARKDLRPAFPLMYAPLWASSLIQVYYAERWGAVTEEVAKTLGDEQGCAFDFPGRHIVLHRVSGIEPEVVAKVWGVRHLCDPGDFHVSGGRWDYGSLLWPGIPEPLTGDQAMRMQLIEVFVTDTVLAMYEGRPEFQIYPEQGAVSYGSQWSVGYTRRIGRDLIAVELRKLYEGAPPDVVRHWHRHAVAPPVGDLATHRDVPNVATRARRIVYALVRLSEALASIASAALNATVTAAETVGLVRHDLDQQGWWMTPHVEPITRHIPLILTEDGFLSRCGALHKLVIEGLNEGIIRRTLLKLSAPEDKIREFRSVRLLDRLLQYALIAIKSGLDPVRHADEIASRLESVQLQTPSSTLFTLNELQVVESHRGDRSRTEKIDRALGVLQIDRRALAPGWGIAIDSLYDALGESLEQSASILEAVLRQIQH